MNYFNKILVNTGNTTDGTVKKSITAETADKLINVMCENWSLLQWFNDSWEAKCIKLYSYTYPQEIVSYPLDIPTYTISFHWWHIFFDALRNCNNGARLSPSTYWYCTSGFNITGCDQVVLDIRDEQCFYRVLADPWTYWADWVWLSYPIWLRRDFIYKYTWSDVTEDNKHVLVDGWAGNYYCELDSWCNNDSEMIYRYAKTFTWILKSSIPHQD